MIKILKRLIYTMIVMIPFCGIKNLLLVTVIKRRLEIIRNKSYNSTDMKDKDIFHYAVRIIIGEQRNIIKGRINLWKS